ncbi:MAG: transposase [Bacteroidales bacterium]|nr:transposase [Bacteroidales bacterium]
MFRKTNKEPQVDLFGGVPSILNGGSLKQYSDDNHWHNQFRKQVVSRIDETVFKVLFNETTGAPNASVSLLVGMMILKESFGWSDSQLFEQCQFNLLVRSALGLFNLNDTLPSESTYYLLRKRMYEHQKQTGEELMETTFKQITSGQVQAFDVNGRSIRMDSKLLGSNIAFYSRYEIIHHTLCLFYKTLDKQEKSRLSVMDTELFKELTKDEPEKTVYRSTREEIKSRLHSIGILAFKIVNTFTGHKGEQYQLLCRVFGEQYKVVEDQQIQLRPREEINSDSVQSPHDPDSAYRHKGGQQVKGHSVNITETASDDTLNLITDVMVEKANVPDTKFVQPAIKSTTEVTGQVVETVYADGAYQSPDNDEFCENIDMVFTGIQGYPSRYDLEMTPAGLIVTDTQTGERIQAVLAKKLKNSKEDRWRITTASGNKYFNQQAIRASELRRTIKQRSIKELYKRNNVEATIFQLSFLLRNNKTRYRGQFKQQIWAYCRCLWINLVRIINFLKQTCQRTFITMEIATLVLFFYQKLAINIRNRVKFSFNFPFIQYILICTNFNQFVKCPF